MFPDYFYYQEDSPSGLKNLVPRGTRQKQDQPQGTRNDRGYWQVKINGKICKVHNIIWELLNGPIPDNMIVDHKDGNPSNNNKSNLRLLSNQDNNRNTLPTATSNYKGVYKDRNRWRQQVRDTNGNRVSLGGYATPEEANAQVVKYKQENNIIDRN